VYGYSLDSAIHFEVVKSLITTGRSIPPDEVYSSIPAMHAWLASTALAGGFSATGAIKYALPLAGAALPLVLYWVSQQAGAPAGPTKYALALTLPASFANYEPFGTTFSLVPVVLLLSSLLLREFHDAAPRSRVTYSIMALLAIAQLTVWHSTTPMLMPILLIGVSLTPVLVKVLDRRAGRWLPRLSFVWLAVLMGVAFVAYHALAQDQIFVTVTKAASKFLSPGAARDSVVPTRLFEISLTDVIRVALLLEGRDALMLALMGLGAFIVWRNRKTWAGALYFYVYWLLVAAVFGAMIVASITGLDYGRFLIVPVTVSPLLAGVALWWIVRTLRARRMFWRGFARLELAGLVPVLFGVWVVNFYNYQPLVPKAKSIDPNAPNEYMLWTQTVNTAYQERMLTFAQTHAAPESKFAIDIAGHRQFMRYFGLQAFYDRRLYLPLWMQEDPDPSKLQFFLLHWPGPAGGLSEQVEWRSAARIQSLYDHPGWGVIYDNGQSFVSLVR
jgi:hypothetical protein